ncbi:histidyl-tRNA synthetase [Desulfurococcus amylolyticus 1221n]|uniref:Histidine--tRNA ligase n=1 Tax=Desulfurococcus amylolyticus (strain DSM 18924 / JCM 16383 / VKM B-2413 / 1221n) TaxID=490899 RepID=B8D606_DESA1|nr:histidine--tRNA ligase [Desulfurococcus amylolyticus]ACL11537.1 histidyl-tRNA synthetase [Desulfurococcus amylolyticus 1221n]
MSEEDVLNPPRGMRDLTGVDAELHEYMVELFKETARRNGFKPIITPTVEYFRLFEKKSGEEIKRSMYVFQDKAGRTLALRPEVTASVVRAYLKEMRSQPKPIRLYYVAQCFRYEEPQKARYREFWQGGLEIIGDPDINADVSAAFTASNFLEELGVKHYYVVGNVATYRVIMDRIGIPEETQDLVLHLIDKDRVGEALQVLRDKTSREDIVELFGRLLNSGIDEALSVIMDFKGLGEGYSIIESELAKTREFIELLNQVGFNAAYEPKLVRGLAYYTGLIFEYKTSGGLSVSIGGGGRYDGLTRVYGGEYEYSTGLALGLDRIMLLLDPGKILPSKTTVLISILEGVPLKAGYELVRRIRVKGVEVIPYRARSLSKALSLANKINAGLVVIIGRREYESGSITVKNMITGEQKYIGLNDINAFLDYIKGAGAQQPQDDAG